MPYISTEALVGAALLVVLAFGYQYIPTSTKTNTGMPGSKAASSKKKNKKRSKQEDKVEVVPVPTDKSSKKGKRKENDSNIVVPTETKVVSTPSNEPKSFAVAAAKPKTLAEKLAPKARKTKVDDMLAPEDRPATHARVMKIVPETPKSQLPSSSATPTPASQPPAQTPALQKIPKFEDDYADISDGETSGDMAATLSNSGTGTGIDEEDGWDVVPSKKKKPISIHSSSAAGIAAQSTALPLGVSTKLQRKNQAKAAAKKASKEAEEADRLKRLSQHRKDLERERINEIYSSNKKAGAGKGKVLGGGSTASVTSTGKLVWD